MYYTVIKHSGHLRTLEKCRKHSPAARVFYISLVFSNARRVLSQCNTRLRLLYLLIKRAELRLKLTAYLTGCAVAMVPLYVTKIRKKINNLYLKRVTPITMKYSP